MITSSEQQYIDLYKQAHEMICEHSSEVMNSVREEAFGRFAASGFPTKKVERYKYTDMQQLFAPDYGLNLQRLPIPVDPYKAFRCDVPNLSTSLYFVVNDAFYEQVQPKGHLPEGVIVGSLKEFATTKYYNQLAGKAGDAVADFPDVELMNAEPAEEEREKRENGTAFLGHDLLRLGIDDDGRRLLRIRRRSILWLRIRRRSILRLLRIRRRSVSGRGHGLRLPGRSRGSAGRTGCAGFEIKTAGGTFHVGIPFW